MKRTNEANCGRTMCETDETNERNECTKWTEWANRNTERNTWTTANRNYRTSYMKLHEGAKPYEGIKPYERTKWTNLTKWTHLTNESFLSLSPTAYLQTSSHNTITKPLQSNSVIVNFYFLEFQHAREWMARRSTATSLLWPTRDDPLFLLKFVVQVPRWSTAHLNSTRYPLDYLSLNHLPLVVPLYDVLPVTRRSSQDASLVSLASHDDHL